MHHNKACCCMLLWNLGSVQGRPGAQGFRKLAPLRMSAFISCHLLSQATLRALPDKSTSQSATQLREKITKAVSEAVVFIKTVHETACKETWSYAFDRGWLLWSHRIFSTGKRPSSCNVLKSKVTVFRSSNLSSEIKEYRHLSSCHALSFDRKKTLECWLLFRLLQCSLQGTPEAQGFRKLATLQGTSFKFCQEEEKASGSLSSSIDTRKKQDAGMLTGHAKRIFCDNVTCFGTNRSLEQVGIDISAPCTRESKNKFGSKYDAFGADMSSRMSAPGISCSKETMLRIGFMMDHHRDYWARCNMCSPQNKTGWFAYASWIEVLLHVFAWYRSLQGTPEAQGFRKLATLQGTSFKFCQEEEKASGSLSSSIDTRIRIGTSSNSQWIITVAILRPVQ